MDDCLCRLNIPYSRVQGQCYDGARVVLDLDEIASVLRGGLCELML